MSKTVSARLPDSKHDDLRERCNQLGCTMNDFVKSSIEYTLDGQTDFDFGDEEDDEPSDIEPDPLKEKRPNPNIEQKVSEFKPHYDSHGNHYTYDENRKMWTCHLNPDNVKIKP